MASLRRPVPRAVPVTTGLRTAALGCGLSPVDVVYSDTCSSAASASASSVSVDSATLPSSYFPLGLCLVGRSLALAGDCRLLVYLSDLERCRPLRLMGVLGTRVHLELAQHLPAERVLRQHAPDGLLDGLLRAPRHELGVRHRAEPAGIAAVPVGHLVAQLVAAEGDLGCVHDDDEIAGVDVRGEDGLVLAAQQHRRLTGQPAKDDVRCVDDVPVALDVSSLRAECAHSHKPSRVSPDFRPAPGTYPALARESAGTSRSSPTPAGVGGHASTHGRPRRIPAVASSGQSGPLPAGLPACGRAAEVLALAGKGGA